MPSSVPPGAARDVMAFAAGPLEGFPPLTMEQLRQLEDPASRGWASHTLDTRGRDLRWPNSVAVLRKSLMTNINLRTARFACCALGDDNVEPILSPCAQLRPGGSVAFVTHLDLSLNGLTDVGLGVIGKVLHASPSCLHTLSLRCNPITLSGLGKFLSYNVPLQSVDFSWCSLVAKTVDVPTEAAVGDALTGLRRNNRTKEVVLRGCAGYISASVANRLIDEAKANRRSKLVASFGKLCHDINVAAEQGVAPTPHDSMLRQLCNASFPIAKDDATLCRALLEFASLDGWPLQSSPSAPPPFTARRKSASAAEPTAPAATEKPSADSHGQENTHRHTQAAAPVAAAPPTGAARHIDPAAATLRDLLRPTYYERPKPTRIREPRTVPAEPQQQQPRTRSVGFEDLANRKKRMLLYQKSIPDELNYQLAGLKPPPRRSPSSASQDAAATSRSSSVTGAHSRAASSAASSRAPSSNASSRSGSPDRPGLDRGAATRTLAAYCAANVAQFAAIFGLSQDDIEGGMQPGSAGDVKMMLSRPMPAALVDADGRPSVLAGLGIGKSNRVLGLAKISFCVQHTGCPVLAVPPALLAVMSTSATQRGAETVRQRSLRNAEQSRVRKVLDRLLNPQAPASPTRSPSKGKPRRTEAEATSSSQDNAARPPQERSGRASAKQQQQPAESRYRAHSQDWIERRRRMNDAVAHA